MCWLSYEIIRRKKKKKNPSQVSPHFVSRTRRIIEQSLRNCVGRTVMNYCNHNDAQIKDKWPMSRANANTLAFHYTSSENPRWGRVWRTELECWVPREAMLVLLSDTINAHSDTTVSTFAGPGTCKIRSWWSLNVIFVWQKVALGYLWHERRIKNDAQKTGIKSKRSVCQAQA